MLQETQGQHTTLQYCLYIYQHCNEYIIATLYALHVLIVVFYLQAYQELGCLWRTLHKMHGQGILYNVIKLRKPDEVILQFSLTL